MIQLELLKSQRGKDLLIHENFIYTLDHTKNSITRWRCQDRTCRGSVFFDDDNNLIRSVTHQHSHVPEKIEKLRLVQSIRNRAISTTERASDIIANHISLIENNETVAIMPHISSLRDCIRRDGNSLLEYIPGSHQDIP